MGQARAPIKLIEAGVLSEEAMASSALICGGFFRVAMIARRIAAQPGIPRVKMVFSQLPVIPSTAGDAKTPIAQPREIEPISRPLAIPCSLG